MTIIFLLFGLLLVFMVVSPLKLLAVLILSLLIYVFALPPPKTDITSNPSTLSRDFDYSNRDMDVYQSSGWLNNRNEIIQHDASQTSHSRSRNDISLQLQVSNSSLIYRYRDWIPEALMPYITSMQNPKSAGNCGFRALCMALGRSEDSWPWMRRELLKELNFFAEEYTKIFSAKAVNNLREVLTHFDGNAPYSKWMDMPSTGYLFASAFHVALVQYSIPSCYTFLPLRNSANRNSMKIVGLYFVEGNHYLKLDLQENCPVPEPVQFWKRYHYTFASNWRSLLEPRIKAFKSLKIKGITERETFEGVPLFVG